MTMLLAIRPAVLAIEINVALVNARALRFVMLDIIHALLMGLKGYAWEKEVSSTTVKMRQSSRS